MSDVNKGGVPAGWKLLSEASRPDPEVFCLFWDGKEVYVDWLGSLTRPHGTNYTHWHYLPKPPASGDMYAAPAAPVAADERVRELESIKNKAARFAALLWDRFKVCPECGHSDGHMPECNKTYETAFRGPRDFMTAFDAAITARKADNATIEDSSAHEDCPHSALDGCQCFEDGKLVGADGKTSES